MYERLFGSKTQDPAVAERIPPGQYKTEKFPVLHYGSVPHIDLATWDFRVWGEVDSPFTLTWAQFKELPRKTVHTDIHCVTRWSKLDTTWEGVAIQTILELAQVRPSATHVVSHAEQGYTANVPASFLDQEGDALFWRVLDSTHGTARLAGDGQTLLFTPEAGFALGEIVQHGRRRDRLKLALRENLKRRKSQARGRSDAGSFESDDVSLDDASGEKP